MISRAAIKANAKAQLGNNLFGNTWLMALVVGLVYGVIIGAAGMTYAGIIILVGPMGIGLSVAGAFVYGCPGEQKGSRGYKA